MAQSNMDSACRGMDVFWAGSSQEPPVSWEEWMQSFQIIVIAKEETDFEDLLQDNVLPDNSYRTLEQRRNRRKRIGSRGMQQ